jgi:hypothetical protein
VKSSLKLALKEKALASTYISNDEKLLSICNDSNINANFTFLLGPNEIDNSCKRHYRTYADDEYSAKEIYFLNIFK